MTPMTQRLSLLALFCLTLFACTLLTDRQDASGTWQPEVWKQFVAQGPVHDNLPDFSTAGYRMGNAELPVRSGPVFNVTDRTYGAVPNDARDDTVAIQKAIDAAGLAGGGVVLLPRGRYDIRQEASAPFLRIRHDAVVIRGEGSGEDGTILHLGSKGPDGTVRRLGSTEAIKEPRSGAALAVMGPETRSMLARITSDIQRGERVVKVDRTDQLSAGMQVVIRVTDPAIDVKAPAPEKADLVRSLTLPYTLHPQQVDTFGASGRELTWITRIQRIVDAQTIELAKPARFDKPLRYQPVIENFAHVREVGIEDLRITSAWAGGYRHHKPFTDADGKIIRTAREQDYLWNGIWISHAADSWVRNVALQDLTQGIIVGLSADMTLRDLRFHGHDGHAGVTVGRSNDVLISGVNFHNRLVHPLTMEMQAFGNVVTNAIHHRQGRDELTSTDSVIDFHGIFPFENLFENMKGFYVCSGGDESVMPHAGVRNVFWNIEVADILQCYDDNRTEFARTWAWHMTSSNSPQTMIEHYPQSFFIGLHRADSQQKDGGLTIGGKSQDQVGNGVTVEGLNRHDIALPSLYRAQQDLRSELRAE